MRTETTTRELYTFDELSDEAKEKARENLRRIELESGDIFWSEGVIEDAATIADILGIELSTRTVKLMNGSTRQEPLIYWNLGYSQGDGAGFSGRYRYAKGSTKAIRKHAPQDAELHRIADTLAKVQRRHFYKLWADISEGRNGYGVLSAVVDTDQDGGAVSVSDADEVVDAIRDFASWIYDRLRREYDYRLSDECIDAGLEDCEFLVDGTLA